MTNLSKWSEIPPVVVMCTLHDNLKFTTYLQILLCSELQIRPYYQLYWFMKFNWNSDILAIFWYIFNYSFETTYARRETKFSPESAFYKLFNDTHYVGLRKSKSGMKLSARPLAFATISLVWAHEIIKAIAHLATVNLLSCKHFISSFDLNPLTYIVDPFYLGALFRQHWFCTQPGGKLTTWVEKFKCLDIELSFNSGVDLGKKI